MLMVMVIACHCVSRVLLFVSHKVGDERIKVLRINEDRRRSKVEKAGDAFPSLSHSKRCNSLVAALFITYFSSRVTCGTCQVTHVMYCLAASALAAMKISAKGDKKGE